MVTQDSNNCRFDSTEYQFYTSKNPVALISKTGDSACAANAIDFSNLSTNASTFAWRFGDGLTSNIKNPTHQYRQSAYQDTTYTTRLIAANYALCKDTTYYTQKVFPTPKVGFSTNTISGCGPLEVAYSNTSQPKDTGTIAIMSFLWDFGQNSTSSIVDSTLIYQSGIVEF